MRWIKRRSSGPILFITMLTSRTVKSCRRTLMVTVGNSLNMRCMTAQVSLAARPNPIRERLFVCSSQSVVTADSKTSLRTRFGCCCAKARVVGPAAEIPITSTVGICKVSSKAASASAAACALLPTSEGVLSYPGREGVKQRNHAQPTSRGKDGCLGCNARHVK